MINIVVTTNLTEVNTNLISHLGTIKSFDKKNLIVEIISQSACAACHAKSACTSADQTVKEIEIQQEEGGFMIGEEVLVLTTYTQGYMAIFYAYLLPLSLLVTSLITLLYFIKNEAIAALGAILILPPYYLLVYLFRKKLKNSFIFTIQKLPTIPQNE